MYFLVIACCIPKKLDSKKKCTGREESKYAFAC